MLQPITVSNLLVKRFWIVNVKANSPLFYSIACPYLHTVSSPSTPSASLPQASQHIPSPSPSAVSSPPTPILSPSHGPLTTPLSPTPSPPSLSPSQAKLPSPSPSPPSGSPSSSGIKLSLGVVTLDTRMDVLFKFAIVVSMLHHTYFATSKYVQTM